MASSIHRNAMDQMLKDFGGVAGLAQDGMKLKLYAFSTSSPSKDGTEGVEFIEIAAGSGYTTGGQTINKADCVQEDAPTPPSPANRQIRIEESGTDPEWTASGGSIADIGGVYLTDSGDNVLAWWERSSALTLADGDTLVADDLTIRLLANDGEA